MYINLALPTAKFCAFLNLSGCCHVLFKTLKVKVVFLLSKEVFLLGV